MQDVAGTIYEGAVAFIRRQYIDHRHPGRRGRRRGRRHHRRRRDRGRRGDPHLRRRAGHPDRHRLPRGRGLLDGLGHHRHVHQRQGQRAHRGRRAHSLVEAVQVAMRGGAVSGFLVVALSLLGVWGIFVALRGARRRRPSYADGAVPHRRLRLRRLVRGPLRPARRRHLHQGRRRRLRPRGQGRGGHPRGRPAQRRVYRRPRRRQRRRLRRPWRGPLRVHRRREHRRDDPGRRRLHHRRRCRLAQPRGLDLLPARGARLRPPGHDRRDVLRPRPRGRGPHEASSTAATGRRRSCRSWAWPSSPT